MAGDYSSLLPWTPVYIALLGVLVAAWRVLPGIMERINERQRDRAMIEADQYQRMDARLQRLEASEERCRQELADLHAERNVDRGRIAELEGYLLGRGVALNEEQRDISAKRLRKDGENG